jgi:hypothetical protein
MTAEPFKGRFCATGGKYPGKRSELLRANLWMDVNPGARMRRRGLLRCHVDSLSLRMLLVFAVTRWVRRTIIPLTLRVL